MGSVIYSPQQLDKRIFQVKYDEDTYLQSAASLKKQGFKYVVVSSFQYDRYCYSLQSSSTARTAFQGFVAFARDLQLVHIVQPQFAIQSYGEHNPIIRIYKIP